MAGHSASTSPAIRLVLSDVDGTLVTHDKILTDRCRHAVAGLRAANIVFAVTSSRPPRGISMIKEALLLTTPISGFNGGLVVKPDDSVVSSHFLGAREAGAVVHTIREHGLDAWLYTDSEWYVTDAAGPHVAREQAALGFAPLVTTDLGIHGARAVKIVGVSDDPALVAACEEEIGTVCEGRVSARKSQPYFLDVTHPQATKGNVVKMLSKLYGIAPAQIATIGDGPNDMLMFRESGLSIAMGNASLEVQQAATHVTASCDDEGFAKAMEQFVIPPA